MSNSLELRRQRAALVAEARDLLPPEGKEMRAEDQQKFDRLMLAADRLKIDIDQAELDAPLYPVARSTRQLASDSYGHSEDDQYRQAFLTWMRHGELPSGAQRSILKTGFKSNAEIRAQGLTGSAGGYTVPQGDMPELDAALKMVSQMRTKARVLRTSDGRTIPWPTANDTSNAATLTAEGTQTASATDIPFGTVNVGAYTYRSLILASLELIQDSAFDLEAYFRAELGNRVGRGTNPHFTTGTGTGQPKGIVTAATAGPTSASGTAVTFDDLIGLQHSVNPAYRQSPSCAWMFNDNVLKALRLIKDSQNRPLWLPGLTVGAPDTILGHPYIINQDMADVALNSKSVIFGDLSKYIIRDVSDMIVLRLVERYADFGQVGFLVFSRHDGQLIDAGTNPVKYLLQAAA